MVAVQFFQNLPFDQMGLRKIGIERHYLVDPDHRLVGLTHEIVGFGHIGSDDQREGIERKRSL